MIFVRSLFSALFFTCIYFKQEKRHVEFYPGKNLSFLKYVSLI